MTIERKPPPDWMPHMLFVYKHELRKRSLWGRGVFILRQTLRRELYGRPMRNRTHGHFLPAFRDEWLLPYSIQRKWLRIGGERETLLVRLRADLYLEVRQYLDDTFDQFFFDET